MRLIGIVLGEENSKIRNSEAMTLLDYGFLNTKFNLVKKNGAVIKKIKLDKSDREMVDIVLKNDLGVVELVSDDKHNYKYEVELDEINLPINSGSVVGKINVLENGKVVSTGDLVINKNAKKLSVLELFYNSIKSICNGNI